MEIRTNPYLPQLAVEIKPTSGNPYLHVPHPFRSDVFCEAHNYCQYSTATHPYNWEVKLDLNRLKITVNDNQDFSTTIDFPIASGMKLLLTLFQGEIERELIYPKTEEFKTKFGLDFIWLWPDNHEYEVTYHVDDLILLKSYIISDGEIERVRHDCIYRENTNLFKSTYAVTGESFVIVRNHFPRYNANIFYINPDLIESTIDKINQIFFSTR